MFQTLAHGGHVTNGGVGPVLLPYQQAWIADASPVKVYEKSRRVGISWAEASDDVLYAAGAAGGDVWYVGYNQDMAREFIGDCAFWARAYDLAAGEIGEAVFEGEGLEGKNILVYRIKFASGHEIVALSSRPANLRGKQGRVVIDEGAFHPDLPGLLKAALALLMWGGQVRVISTHDGEENAFNDLVADIRAGRKPYSLHRTDIEEALAAGLYRRICLKRGLAWSPEAEAAWRRELFAFYGEDADEELLCIPKPGGGAYLPRHLIESRMREGLPVLRWTCPAGFTLLPQHIREAEARDWCEEHLAPVLAGLDPAAPTSFGEDFGRSGDLTVIAPVQETPLLLRSVPFLVELRNVPFEQQRQVLFRLVDRLPRFRRGAMDARGNGQYLAEVAMQRYGARVEPVMLTVEWYREEMPPFKAAFEDAAIEIPKDRDVLDDLRALRMEKGVAKVPEAARTRDGKDSQRHGDAAIALALAHYASRQAPIRYEFEPVRPRGQEEDLDEWQRGRAVRTTAGFGLGRGAW
jgi:phage FluMu gp28-like protein